MAGLLFFVLVVEVLVQIVNTFSTTVDSLLWTIYTTLPTALSRQISEQRKLQKEYLKCRSDLHATSSQDEFAKWAKLRRHHDKMLTDLEGKKAAVDKARTSFGQVMAVIRWLGTRGTQQVVGFYYRKTPLLWLSSGWFPYYAEWIISWPSAPMGSVSIVMWQWACAGLFTLLVEGSREIWGLITGHSSLEAGVPPTPSPREAAAARSKHNKNN